MNVQENSCPTTCPSREELAALLDNEPTSAVPGDLEAHLASCESCRARLDALAVESDWWNPRQAILRDLSSGTPTWEKQSERGMPRRTELIPFYNDSPHDTPADLPQQIGPWHIEAEIGRGGMGIVYKAHDPRLERTVALKVLRQTDTSEDRLRRLQREAKTLAHINHPNIVQIFDVGEWDGLPWLALEYVPGVNLAQYLDHTPQPADASAAFVETLARAMHVAHEAGIVHRDLKPANILLTGNRASREQGTGNREQKTGIQEQGTRDHSLDRPSFCSLSPVPCSLSPKITDFGLAKRLDVDEQVTKSGFVAGTPCNMAPEQARSAPAEISPVTDVYALGTILYEMLTGRPPFKGESPVQTLHQVLYDEPISPASFQRELPHDLVTICLKCLEKEPSRRYASALELAEDLRRYRAGEPILARPTPVWERAWKWARRRPVGATLLGATIIACLALLATWYQFTAQLQIEKDHSDFLAGEADRQKLKALNSLKQARAAAQQFYHLVRDDVDLKKQGLEPLRLRLLKQTTALQEKLLADYSEDPQLRNEQAKSYHLLTQLTYQIGTPKEAFQLIQKAIDIGEKLVRSHPGEREYALNLSSFHSERGYILRSRNRPEEAEAAFRRTIELLQPWLSRPPEADRHRLFWLLAIARVTMGQSLRRRGRTGKAETAYLAARDNIVEAQKQWSGPDRIPNDYFNTEAVILGSLGIVHEIQNRRKEAGEAYQRAVEIREGLVRRQPGYPSYERGLAASYRNLAWWHYRGGDLRQAIAIMTKGRDVQSQLATAHPKVRQYQVDLVERFTRPLSDWQREK